MSVPTLLIPGLMATPRLYADQLPALWRLGPVMVADHRGADSMKGLAEAILADAPPRIRLLGLSMGGYIAFEIVRQAPQRITALALLDTSARPDAPEQSQTRRDQITLAHEHGMSAVADGLYPRLVHPDRGQDEALRQVVREMAEDTGADAFARQQLAIMTRPDSRPGLAAIDCPTVVMVGNQDQITPPPVAEEMAGGIGKARLVVIPDSGHLSTLERPQVVTAALMDAWGDTP
jgi:pimeloyl-ACP methyl ester carboxylesterase